MTRDPKSIELDELTRITRKHFNLKEAKEAADAERWFGKSLLEAINKKYKSTKAKDGEE